MGITVQKKLLILGGLGIIGCLGIWLLLQRGGMPPLSSGIAGTVLIGPTCPVVREPPDPGCDDKPYATQLVLTSVDGEREMMQFSSDSSGKFSISVAPGSYGIRSAAVANILPYCQSSVEVTAGAVVQTTVYCDSGIR